MEHATRERGISLERGLEGGREQELNQAIMRVAGSPVDDVTVLVAD